MLIITLQLSHPGMAQNSSDVQSKCRQELDAMDNKMRECNTEYEQIKEDMRNGLYCNKCGQSKTELDKTEGFYKHLQNVKGEAVPANAQQMQAAHQRYLSKFNSLKSSYESKQKSCGESYKSAVKAENDRANEEVRRRNEQLGQQQRDAQRHQQEQQRQAQQQAEEAARQRAELQQRLAAQQEQARAELLAQSEQYKQDLTDQFQQRGAAMQQGIQSVTKLGQDETIGLDPANMAEKSMFSDVGNSFSPDDDIVAEIRENSDYATSDGLNQILQDRNAAEYFSDMLGKGERAVADYAGNLKTRLAETFTAEHLSERFKLALLWHNSYRDGQTDRPVNGMSDAREMVRDEVDDAAFEYINSMAPGATERKIIKEYGYQQVGKVSNALDHFSDRDAEVAEWDFADDFRRTVWRNEVPHIRRLHAAYERVKGAISKGAVAGKIVLDRFDRLRYWIYQKTYEDNSNDYETEDTF